MTEDEMVGWHHRLNGHHFLIPGIFLAQGSNPGLLYCRWTLYPLSHQGSPIFFFFMVGKRFCMQTKESPALHVL